jgi:hypothetical protein
MSSSISYIPQATALGYRCVFAPLKAAYRDQVERLERGGIGTIGKQSRLV